jgi:hypothetical protein
MVLFVVGQAHRLFLGGNVFHFLKLVYSFGLLTDCVVSQAIVSRAIPGLTAIATGRNGRKQFQSRNRSASQSQSSPKDPPAEELTFV